MAQYNPRMTTETRREAPPRRAEFRAWRSVPTRWMDNDHYGHVNNVVYYSYFDTAVNGYLIDTAGLDIRTQPAIGLVVETSCQFLRTLSFPETLDVGLRVLRLGASSIVYRIGVFKLGVETAAAVGRFVHVYVDAQTRRSTSILEPIRAAVEPLV